MPPSQTVRDAALLDALESTPPAEFHGPLWRVVRAGRNVLQPGRPGGRWDNGAFDVLYTSLAANGAVAEMRHHIARGQPVIPSMIQFRLFELSGALNRALKLADLNALAALGVDTSRYGLLAYEEQAREYPRTQDIGEAAFFLGFDGLIAPSARCDCLNAILFTSAIAEGDIAAVEDLGLVDWAAW